MFQTGLPSGFCFPWLSAWPSRTDTGAQKWNFPVVHPKDDHLDYRTAQKEQFLSQSILNIQCIHQVFQDLEQEGIRLQCKHVLLLYYIDKKKITSWICLNWSELKWWLEPIKDQTFCVLFPWSTKGIGNQFIIIKTKCGKRVTILFSRLGNCLLLIFH